MTTESVLLLSALSDRLLDPYEVMFSVSLQQDTMEI
jgi:hypothetical protein